MDDRDPNRADITKRVDARWTPCPGTLMEAKAGISELNDGEVMEILTHDPEAHGDVLAWATKAGHEFLGFYESEEYDRLFVKKKSK